MGDTEQGHSVLTASSAEEGLEKAIANPIDLLVLDVRLPGEDGISALPSFRNAIGDAPVVVMTAFGDLETAADFYDQYIAVMNREPEVDV